MCMTTTSAIVQGVHPHTPFCIALRNALTLSTATCSNCCFCAGAVGGGVVIFDKVIEWVFRTNYPSVNKTTRTSLQAWANSFTRHCCAPYATVAITCVHSTVNALQVPHQTWKKNDGIKWYINTWYININISLQGSPPCVRS